MFKKILPLAFSLTLMSSIAFADKANFTCSIFSNLTGAQVEGSLSLSGANSMQQTYQLQISEQNSSRQFTGEVYLQGKIAFTTLTAEVQKKIQYAMATSRRLNLKTGDLVVFSNTKTGKESTLNIYLMPSGEIGYIQAGVLELLCM